MKTSRFFLILFLLTVLLLGGSKAALAAPAIPPTPSSFYGEIHFQSGDGEPAEGAYVEAYVPGVSGYVARDALTTNNENLVYAMNIPGDDSYTAEKDGGLSGDTITFKIGGRIVATSTWAGGTDVRQHIHPPKASAGDYYSVKVNEAVQVVGSASDWLAGEALNYAWDLDNDGSFDDSTAQAPSYTFTTTGTKTVHLKVTDSKGGEGISSAKVFVYTLGGTTGQTYDGTAHTITMTGIEAPYSYIIYYGTQDGTPPVNAGTFNSVIDVYDGPDLVEKIGYTLVIDPRPITIQADNQSKLLGAADPALTYTVTAGNLVTGNDLTGALTRESGETVGTYAILQGTLTAGSNYNLTFVPGTLTIEAVQHNISLVEGWNLVSLDLAPTSTAVEDVLASIEGSYDLVYAWDATGGHSSSGNWMKYDNEVASPDSLTAIDETMGFWVHMLAADTLSVEGTPPGISQINLWNDVGGWNLVSFPNTGPLAMPGALEDHYVENANYTLVYAYQASDTEDPWKLYDKDAPTYANDLTSMVPTWGYWIFVTIDEVWNVGD